MSIVKWSPFFFEPFEEESEKMMQELSRSLLPTNRGQSGLIPPIDLYETEDALVVETPLAGIDPNKIQLSIENGVLIIKAASERKTEVDEKNYYRKEVRYGTVFRQVALPTAVIEDKAEAQYEDGILKISLPKKGATSKTIKVDIKKK